MTLTTSHSPAASSRNPGPPRPRKSPTSTQVAGGERKIAEQHQPAGDEAAAWAEGPAHIGISRTGIGDLSAESHEGQSDEGR